MTESSTVIMVFIRYSDEDLAMLFMTRRPSTTTSGMDVKLLSMSTRCATLRAASAPEAMDTAQSAWRMARMSFTPSPVMATVWPLLFRLLMMMLFCSGVTRPNTV